MTDGALTQKAFQQALIRDGLCGTIALLIVALVCS